MSNFILHSTTNTLTLYPTFEYSSSYLDLSASHTTQEGRIVFYNWGGYTEFKLPLDNISEEIAAQINTWHFEQTDLTFVTEVGSSYSVVVKNNVTPFNSTQRPYEDRFKDVLILEEI